MIQTPLLERTPDSAGSRTVEKLIDTEYARGRVAKSLYEAIVDGVEFGPRDLATAGDRDWIRDAIAPAIAELTEVALHVLGRRLSLAIEAGPDCLLERFEASHQCRELGWE